MIHVYNHVSSVNALEAMLLWVYDFFIKFLVEIGNLDNLQPMSKFVLYFCRWLIQICLYRYPMGNALICVLI